MMWQFPLRPCASFGKAPRTPALPDKGRLCGRARRRLWTLPSCVSATVIRGCDLRGRVRHGKSTTPGPLGGGPPAPATPLQTPPPPGVKGPGSKPGPIGSVPPVALPQVPVQTQELSLVGDFPKPPSWTAKVELDLLNAGHWFPSSLDFPRGCGFWQPDRLQFWRLPPQDRQGPGADQPPQFLLARDLWGALAARRH